MSTTAGCAATKSVSSDVATPMATSAALQRHSSASATHLRSAAADTGHTGWRRSDCTCSLPQLNQMRSWHASTRAFCGSAKTQCTSSDAAGQIKSGKPANVSSSQWQLEYTGVVSSTIKTLKRVSLGTAAMSMIGSPLYLAYAMDGTYGAVKVFSATGFTCFGLFTTGLLHWFVGPYVHKLWYDEEHDRVKVQMLDLLSRPRFHEFALEDRKFPESIKPLQTFEADGTIMFIDEDSFENKPLLHRLIPLDPHAEDVAAAEEGSVAAAAPPEGAAAAAPSETAADTAGKGPAPTAQQARQQGAQQPASAPSAAGSPKAS